MGNDVSIKFGPVCPLPYKIPNPSSELRQKMESFGFIFDDESLDYIYFGENKACDTQFIEYTMPQLWTIKNNSSCEDLPIYYFVDETNKKRICISGAWKRSYDNDLSIYECQ